MPTPPPPEPSIQISPTTVPILVDFLNAVPHQLTAVLVGLAPYISRIRYAAEIASWRSSWYDSWLALAAWWVVCLLAEPGIRYLLPITIIFILSLVKWTSHPRSIPPLITEHNLQTTISDLTAIQSLIPTISLPSPTTTLLRVSLILYIPYLLLTYFVPLRILLGIAGSLLLSWRAPWSTSIRHNLRRSAWVRWSSYHTWSFLTNQSLPARAFSFQPTPTTPKPVNSIRFLFTIHENQRWWMGLDWTAALLPGERPSWCSATQHPVSPPNAFALPEETTVFLADGKGGRVKRTATWRWEEGEWRVLVKKEGSGLSRVERPLPTGKEENPTGSRLLKAAGKMKESGFPASGPSGGGNAGSSGTDQDGDDPEDDEGGTAEAELATDADGWVYGDNKWEGQSSKGGMGKYTRFRRWTRVAIVSEVVEVVEDGEVGIQRRSSTIYSDALSTSPTTATDHDDATVSDAGTEDDGKGRRDSHDDSPLRQRLKLALNKGSVH